MLLVLTSGLALWIIDRVIVAANGVGGTLSGIMLVYKIRHDPRLSP
jgi:hypothetical protein